MRFRELFSVLMVVFGTTGAVPVVERVGAQIWRLLGRNRHHTRVALLEPVLVSMYWDCGADLLKQSFVHYCAPPNCSYE